MKNKTKLTALSGLLTAVSVVLMLPTLVIPVLTYISPMIAGIVTIIVINIANKKYAVGVFFATSIISLIILTDKEASLLYLLFFGYYPIIADNLEKMKKVLCIAVKYTLFNASCVISSLLGIYVFGVPIEDFTGFGKYSAVILLSMGNVVFFLYEISLKKYKPVLKVLSAKLLKSVK